MLVPTIPGWTAETIGDDICWMKFGADGRLYAINPEAGFFGVAPGTGYDTNANAMNTLWGNCIYTNTALTDDGDVWWEGMTEHAAGPCHRLAGSAVELRESDTPAAHPNARFTAPASQCPSIADEWEDPAGVPISAILFGGRRRTTVPLVTEAHRLGARRVPRLDHGVGDHRRPAGRRRQAALRPDGDAAVLWLQLRRLLRALAVDGRRRTDAAKLPKIFFVNWFRRDDDGRFLWPGYGENSRVLKWVFERVDGGAEAIDTPIGRLPTSEGFDTDGLEIDPIDLDTLLSVDTEGWKAAIPQIREHFATFGDRLPASLNVAVDVLEANLGAAG